MIVVGGWALVICLSHGRASWRDFLYCVHVVVYEELSSWGAKRWHTGVCCLMYCLLYAYGFTDSVVCGYERISREF